MRVKITKPLSGNIDGIQLSRFVVGLTYEVRTALGNCLLAMGAVISVDDDQPAFVLPLDKVADIISPIQVPSVAVDRPELGRERERRRDTKGFPCLLRCRQ